VLIVAAPGMSSVVFEMRRIPREVESRRTGATTLDIEIGHVTAGQTRDVLRMPEGVLLARELSVEDGGRGDDVLAHLVVPQGVQSRLRLEGRRVYVDLAWPAPPWQIGKPGPKPPALLREKSDLHTVRQVFPDRPTGANEYGEQLRSAIERFEQVQPFLISATESADSEVRAVLARTLDGVSTSLAAATPPSELAANHQRLVSSIATASNAMSPSFVGDRIAATRQAVAMFEEARK
jgi:hypothetical protein